MTEKLGGELPRRVVLVRALRGLGDLLCVVPALRALRAGLPQTKITMVGLPEIKSLVLERFGRYVDDWLDFPGYPGLAEQQPDLAQIPAFFVETQKRKFDLAIQMHGSGVILNPVTVMLGAKYNAGFYERGQFCPDEQRFLEFKPTQSEVLRYLELIELLGFKRQGEYLEFPILAADEIAFRELALELGLRAGEYVCLHPGASVPQRRWPVERFAKVGDWLAGQGLRVILTGSTGEAELTQALGQAMKAPFIDLAGQTGLGVLAALLCRARLLVCNDTGVSHLAAALQVPSVVIFSDSDPERWSPLDRERHRSVARVDGRVVGQAKVIAEAEKLIKRSQVQVSSSDLEGLITPSVSESFYQGL